MPSIGQVVAYAVCGVPALVGTAYVARHGYATSDTPESAAGTAFLFGMIAAGAYVCPLLAVALATRGRGRAAILFAALSLFALFGNWTNTLDALTLRNAGKEAEAGKAVAQEKDRRAELRRIEGERERMVFTAATDAEVSAAQGAVTAAERSKAAECGKRGPFCRQRETDEATARETLRRTLANKAATDAAARLDQRASDLRRRLDTSKAAPEGNRTLADTIARMLSLSAATAATAQQGYVSALVEALIAAALALPELLTKQGGHMAKTREREREGAEPAEPEPEAAPIASEPAQGVRSIAGVPLMSIEKPTATGNVGAFMLACLSKAKGAEAPITAIFARYRRWCDESVPRMAALDASEFAAQFKTACERRIAIESRGGRAYCLDVQLAA